MPEAHKITEAFEARAKAAGMTRERLLEFRASKNHARRLMTVEETANMASGMTGTTVNLTMGSLDD